MEFAKAHATGSFFAQQRRLERPQFRVAIQHIFQRRAWVGWGFLRHVGQSERGWEIDFAGVSAQFAPNERKQTRLTRAISAREANFLAGMDDE